MGNVCVRHQQLLMILIDPEAYKEMCVLKE